MKDLIIETMQSVAEMTESYLVQDINDDTILLESGIDSLGFAILVSRLEEELGYDPFTLMVEPIYPQTFAEFVDIYQKFGPSNDNVNIR